MDLTASSVRECQLQIDHFTQEREGDPPVAFVGIALYGPGLLVDTHDGADALVQVLVGKSHRVTDHEVSTLRTWRWRLGRSGGIGDDRGIGQGPAPARSGILDHGLAKRFATSISPSAIPEQRPG